MVTTLTTIGLHTIVCFMRRLWTSARTHLTGRAFAGVAIVIAASLVAFTAGRLTRFPADPPEAAGDGIIAKANTDLDEHFRLMDGGALRIAPIATVAIDRLIAAYRENPFAAAATYGNLDSARCIEEPQDTCRVVEVTATVRDLGRDDRGAYLTLATTEEFVSVSARFGKAEEPSLSRVRKGERVRIACLVTYETTASGVALTRCGLRSP
jgi:hypothetical protein